MRNLNSECGAQRVMARFPVSDGTSCVFKKPPNAASDPFSQQLDPLSRCRLLCACPSIFVEILKLRKEVIISSSQSFRQNEDTIRFYLNK